MTYLEKAVEEYRKRVLKFDCPHHHIANGPLLDITTEVMEGDFGVGCRGIKCEECWNKEMEEE